MQYNALCSPLSTISDIGTYKQWDSCNRIALRHISFNLHICKIFLAIKVPTIYLICQIVNKSTKLMASFFLGAILSLPTAVL